MHKSPAQIAAIVADADPDSSGVIEFEEFVAVLSKQMASGGEMATLFNASAAMFGWLQLANPANWFSSAQADQPAPPPQSPPPPNAHAAAASETDPSTDARAPGAPKSVSQADAAAGVPAAAAAAGTSAAAPSAAPSASSKLASTPAAESVDARTGAAGKADLPKKGSP